MASRVTDDMVDAAAEELPPTSGPDLGRENRRKWARAALKTGLAARVPWWRRLLRSPASTSQKDRD